MSEQDKIKPSEDEQDEEESDSSPDSSPPPPKATARARGRAEKAPAQKPVVKPASLPASRAGLFVVLALAAGGAAGWFGHIQQAKAQVQRADSAAAPAGSGVAGPCGSWQEKICASNGATSAACQQAKGATDLLTPSTCQAALGVLPATLAKLKAARASCDSLVKKLCADLPQGSSTCEMVKERTPSFPAKRCEDMLKNYDAVISELRSMDQQGGLQGGPGGPGMQPGMPHGTPPGMPPGH
jgi:hypothetical protein